MMKSKKFVLLLALIPLVIGCGGKNNSSDSAHESSLLPESSQSSNAPDVSSDASSIYSSMKDSSIPDPGSSSSVKPSSSGYSPSSSGAGESSSKKKGWSIGDKLVFQNNLYGYVLPYYFIPGNSVQYNLDSNMILVMGGDCKGSDLEAWADLIVADGFTMEVEDFYYTFEKPIQTDLGLRTLVIEMAALDEEYEISPTGDGMFFLGMYDPYIYDWPAEKIAADLQEIAPGTTSVVPAFNADKYAMNENYLEEGMFAVFCFTNSKTAEADYAAALKKAGWDVPLEKNDGYFMCLSESEDLELDFAYAEDSGTLDIIIGKHTPLLTAWPTADVAEAVAYVTGNTTTVLPAYNGADRYALVLDYIVSRNLFVIYCYTEDENALEDYYVTLQRADYDINPQPDEDDYYEAYSPNEDLYVYFGYDADYGSLDIYAMGTSEPEPIDWPAEDIAELLQIIVPGTKTVIPPIACTEIYYDYYEKYDCVLIDCYGPDSDTLLSYVNNLARAGWEVEESTEYYDDYYCLSPAKDVTFEVYLAEDTAGDICCEFYIEAYGGGGGSDPAPWPTEDVATEMEKLVPGTTTVIPALLGDEYYVEYYEDEEVVVLDVYGLTTTAQLAAYANVLEAAGWTVEDSEDYPGYEYFALSPAEDVIIDVYLAQDRSGNLLIELVIYAYETPSYLDVWPTQELAADIQVVAPGATTVVPEFEAEQYELKLYSSLNLVLIVAHGQDDNALEDYVAALELAGWEVTEDPQYNDDYHCVSPNKDIEIEVYLDVNDDIEIVITPYVFVEGWPYDDVADMLEDMGATGDIPAPTYAGATGFQVSYYPDYGWAGVVVFVAEGNEDAGIAAYYAQLEGLGYTLYTTDGYGVDYYTLPGTNIAIGAYVGTPGSYTIDVIMTQSSGDATWPADDVASLVASTGATGTIPEPEYPFTDYEIYNSQGLCAVLCSCPVGEEEDAVLDYMIQLMDAGFVGYYDQNSDIIMIDEDNNLGIYVFEVTDGYIAIQIVYVDMGGSGGGSDIAGDTPGEKFVNWLKACSLDYPAPDFEFTVDVDIEYDISSDPQNTYGLYFDMYVFAENDADLEEAFENIVASLIDAGYDMQPSGGNSYVAYSDDDNLGVYVNLDEEGYIFVDIAYFSW